MKKVRKGHREIQFNSQKNNGVVSAWNERELRFIKKLESDTDVRSFSTNVMLDKDMMANISKAEIYKNYFDTEWVTDFHIKFRSGEFAVRELESVDSMQKTAAHHRLELSRRYWESLGITNWRVVITTR